MGALFSTEGSLCRRSGSAPKFLCRPLAGSTLTGPDHMMHACFMNRMPSEKVIVFEKYDNFSRSNALKFLAAKPIYLSLKRMRYAE